MLVEEYGGHRGAAELQVVSYVTGRLHGVAEGAVVHAQVVEARARDVWGVEVKNPGHACKRRVDE